MTNFNKQNNNPNGGGNSESNKWDYDGDIDQEQRRNSCAFLGETAMHAASGDYADQKTKLKLPELSEEEKEVNQSLGPRGFRKTVNFINDNWSEMVRLQNLRKYNGLYEREVADDEDEYHDEDDFLDDMAVASQQDRMKSGYLPIDSFRGDGRDMLSFFMGQVTRSEIARENHIDFGINGEGLTDEQPTRLWDYICDATPVGGLSDIGFALSDLMRDEKYMSENRDNFIFDKNNPRRIIGFNKEALDDAMDLAEGHSHNKAISENERTNLSRARSLDKARKISESARPRRTRPIRRSNNQNL